MKAKIESLAALIEQQHREEYLKQFPDTIPALINDACKVTIKEGVKYTKIDVGHSGKYMIENATGDIFGIKGYGVIHRGHFYGTLDTTNLYYWGHYHAQLKKEGVTA
jgi:hypothetical protein